MKWKAGLRNFNETIMDAEEIDDPIEFANDLAYVFNTAYGILPGQARFLLTRLGIIV